MHEKIRLRQVSDLCEMFSYCANLQNGYIEVRIECKQKPHNFTKFREGEGVEAHDLTPPPPPRYGKYYLPVITSPSNVVLLRHSFSLSDLVMPGTNLPSVVHSSRKDRKSSSKNCRKLNA